MRGSTKATTNYVVDVVIAAAFLVSAVTGVIFLLPTSWVDTAGSDGPSLAWVPIATWRTLHEWSSLVMIAGVVLHAVLHWRWVVAMTKKTFAPPRVARSASPTSATASVVPATHPAPAAFSTPATAAPAPEDAGAPAMLVCGRGAAPVCGRGAAPRRTRREVLVGLGMVGAAVVTGGLAGRALASQLLERSASAKGTDAGSAGSGPAPGETSATGDGSNAGGDVATDGSSTAESSSSGAQVTDRVVIDEARCNGCGHCLQSCPYGVFSWGGSTAVVGDAEACRLCGRCLQSCPTMAITLNA